MQMIKRIKANNYKKSIHKEDIKRERKRGTTKQSEVNWQNGNSKSYLSKITVGVNGIKSPIKNHQAI